MLIHMYLFFTSLEASSPRQDSVKLSRNQLSSNADIDEWHERDYVASVHCRVEWTAPVSNKALPSKPGNTRVDYFNLAATTASDANHE